MSTRHLAPTTVNRQPRDPSAAAIVTFGYWREDPAGVFGPVTDRGLATHVLDSDGAVTLMTPIDDAESPTRMSIAADVYLIYGF